MWEVLSEGDASPGGTFTLSGGIQYAHCDLHTGGTWTLQVQSPGGVWTDAGGSFDAVGIKKFETHTGALCRWAGGTTGARIWSTGVL